MNAFDWIWTLAMVAALLGQCIYMHSLAKRARLAERLVMACGGEELASALIERLERQNDEALAGGLSALLFTKRNTPK